MGHIGNRGIEHNGVQGVCGTGVWGTWAMRYRSMGYSRYGAHGQWVTRGMGTWAMGYRGYGPHQQWGTGGMGHMGNDTYRQWVWGTGGNRYMGNGAHR